MSAICAPITTISAQGASYGRRSPSVADQQPGFQRQPRRDGQLHYHFDHPLKREGLSGAGSRALSVALASDQDVNPQFISG
jgi:hypothetical protein